MKSKSRSPYQISGLVFLAVVLVGIVGIALITLFLPGAMSADAAEFISSATCPAAIILAVIAYFWTKNRPNNE